MTGRSRVLLLLTLALAAVIGLGWWQAPWLARRAVFPGQERSPGDAKPAPTVAEIQEQVRAARPALGLAEQALAEETTEPRTDAAGSWEVLRQRWVLPAGVPASDLGQRLRALVVAQQPSVDAYAVAGAADAAQTRFYAGSRLACVVDLIPTLDPWPTLAPEQRPLIALVLDDIDVDPFAARKLMERGQPLTLALSPYSPFTLRLARDALATHTEVLAQAVPDATPSEALDGVPQASGLLIACVPPGDPEAEARALAAAAVYVLDATDEGLETRWSNALGDAGVPVVRAFRATDGDASQRRLRHHAARRGGAALAVAMGSGQAEDAYAALVEAGARGYRVAFLAEVVAAVRR